jgi:D-alanine-D-alanine ligase
MDHPEIADGGPSDTAGAPEGVSEAEPVVAPPLPRDQRATLPSRINLIVVFGGQSAEHEVSRVTAAHVLRAVDRSRYRLSALGITREGTWFDATQQVNELPNLAAAEGIPVLGEPTTTLPLASAGEGEGEEIATVVLPLLHGPNGEDGTVQGFLELSGLPYVGSGVLGSAVSMDKVVAKELCAQHGIPQARWTWLHERDVNDVALMAIGSNLGYPVFVKPANLGSSVGISKATDLDALILATRVALEHDETVVFEESINGREIEIAVLGNEHPRMSVPGEVIPAAEFYDYADKYQDGAAQLVIPAQLPAHALAELPELVLRAYRALRCQDLARVDFFYEESGRGWLLNEINTMPGFTPISMYPRLWEASGLSYSGLIDELVHLALDRAAHRGARRR